MLSVTRIWIGFILPLALIYGFRQNQPLIILLVLFIGEIIDRIEFYIELKIITPKDQIRIDMLIALSAN